MMAATLLFVSTASLATAGLVATQTPYVREAMAAAEKAEKMGIIGILATCLILSLMAIAWIVRQATTEWKTLMTQAITAANNAAVGAQRLESASAKMEQAAVVLAEITAHCRVHGN